MKYTFLDEHGLQTAWEIIKLYFRSLSQTLTKNNIIDLKNIDNSNSNSGGLISLELSDKLASIEEGALVNYLIKVNNTPTPATEEGIVNIVIPTSISAFDNDSEYLTEDDVVELISDLLEGPTLLSDWAETDDLLITFIKNKPEIPSKVSDLLNDSNFVSKDYVDSADTTLTARIRAEEDFRMAADNNLVAADNALSGRISDIEEILPSGGSSTNTLTTMNWVRNKINAAVEPKADKSEAIGSLSLAINSTNFLITLSGTKVDGTSFTVQDVIDLPLESVVVSGSYDDTTKKVILTLQNGSVIDFSVADLVAGLQSEINSSNKLPSDLVDDTNCLNKFVTTLEKSQWNNKYDKPSGGIPKTDLENSVQTSLGKADTALQEEVDPIFSSSPASEITSLDIVNWNSKYDKPSNGIPETDLALSVQDSLEAADTAYLKPSSGIPSTDMSLAVLDSLDLADSAYLKPNTGIPKSDLAQGVLDSLNLADTAIQTETDPTVPSYVKNISLTNITNWNNKYTKPSGGIPASDMTTAVQTSLGKADTAYQKPSSGIPSTDLSAGVLSSLDKADTALLSETDPIFSASPAAGITSNDITNWNNKTSNTGTITSVKMNGTTIATSGEADLGTVITDVSDKANKNEMSVNTSGDQTTITLKNGTSATVINAHQSLSNYVLKSQTSGLLKNDGTVDTNSYVTTETVLKTNSPDYELGWEHAENNGIPSVAVVRDKLLSKSTFNSHPASTITLQNITNWNNKYTKPSGGIPSTDMTQAVLNSLAAADRAVQPGDLANVATSGDYDDLLNKPDLSVYAESSDLATVATSGSYNDLTNKPDLSVYAETNDLATVATTGSYEDLLNKPTIPTIPNLSKGTTTGNGNAVTDISVSGHTITLTKGTTFLTEHLDISGKANKTDAIGSLTLSMDSSTYVITLSGTKADGTTSITSLTIDLPLETVVVGGSYNSSTKKVILTLKNNLTVEFSVADLIDGLQSTIDSSHKLSADLVDDSNTTNKFVTALDKTNWNKQADWNLTTTSAIDFIKNKPDITVDGNDDMLINGHSITINGNGSAASINLVSNEGIGLNATYLTLTGSGGNINFNAGEDEDQLLIHGNEGVFIEGANNKNIKLTTSGNGKAYYNNKEIAVKDDIKVTSVNGMIGAIILESEDITPHDYSHDYLTFTALQNTTFTFTRNALQYSLNNGTTWTTLAANTASPTITTGNKILWKQTGLTPTIGASSGGIGIFSSTGNFNVSGNIMSLYYGDEFIGKTDLTGKNYAFLRIFQGCDKLVNAENLILPATTLANSCYHYMFNGCISLTTAPELPATELASSCYIVMFNGCTSLTKAPELPATTLAQSCYSQMFSGCISLATAPKLPATTLAKSCYNSMFRGCTSLTIAPELPATTLTNTCYQNMFRDCTSLNYIKCLATDISASNCTSNWVQNVSSTGTFIKANSMTSWTTGNNGIPTGWNAYTENEWKEVKKYELDAAINNITYPVTSVNGLTGVVTVEPNTFVVTFSGDENDNVICDHTIGEIALAYLLGKVVIGKIEQFILLLTTCIINTNLVQFTGFLNTSEKDLNLISLVGNVQNNADVWKFLNEDMPSMPIGPDVLIVAFEMSGETITCDTTIDEIFNAIENRKYVYGIFPVFGYWIMTPSFYSENSVIFSTILHAASNNVQMCSVQGATNNNTDTWQFVSEDITTSLANVIESISVNGVNQSITDKNVNITIPVTSVNNKTGAVILNSDDVRAVRDYSKEYLTFTALQDTTFTFTTNALQYSLDNGATWTTLAADAASPIITARNKILWKQTGLTPIASTGIGTFSATGNFDISGNIMSLYYGDNFIGQTDLTGKSHAFNSLFYHNTKLINSLNLVLPATTLSDNCYRSMFNGCTSLKTTPEVLPATSSTEYCYKSMFYGCTSLVTAPKTLPATTLAEGCYQYMFYNCILLTTAPELPATTLADSCYQYMLQKCASLNYIKCLATNISIRLCVNYWVKNVSSSGTFIRADSMTSWPSGQHGIPTGWNAYSESEWKEVKHYELADVAISGSYNDLTNRPTIPTVPTNVSSFTNDANYATTSDVSTAVSNLVNLAPSTLDTLNELATALGNDPNFATTVATLIGGKVSKVSSTDNAIVRFDGTSGDIQNSGVTIDDSNRLNSFLNIEKGNSNNANVFITNKSASTDYGEIFVSNADKSHTTRPLVLLNGYGNVGIGVALPSSKLEVSGSIKASTNVTAAKFITNGGTYSQFVKGDGSLDSSKYVKEDTYMMPANSFGGSSKAIHINSILNGFYAMASRWDVTLTGFTSPTANKNYFFDGNYDTYKSVPAGTTGTILIEIPTGVSPYAYTYGYLYVSFYYTYLPESVSVRAYGTQSSVEGWYNYSAPTYHYGSSSSTLGVCLRFYNSSTYDIKKWEITVVAKQDKACYVTLLDHQWTRGSQSMVSAVTKYPIKLDLYGDVEAPKFIKRGGTSSQFLKADGSVDSNTYINTGTILKTTDSGYEGGWEHAGDNAIPTVAVVQNKLIQKSSTSGLVKNDGTIDTNTYLTSISAGDNVVVSGNEVSVPTFPVNKIVPMYEKTYENYTCGNASTNDLYIFFGNVVATSNRFQDPWEIYYTLKVSTSTDACLGEYDVRISCTGTTIVYSIYNRFYSSSYYPIYLHYFLYHDNATKYGNRETYPFKIGTRIQSAYLATSLARTYTIKVWETRGCTFNFPNNIETYTNIYNSSNYGSTSVNAYSTGLQETGDSTDTTTMLLYYSRVKAGLNGIKLYSLIMQDANGTWQSFTTGAGGTGTTKVKNPIGFALGSSVYYVSLSSDYAAGTNVPHGAIRAYQSIIDLRNSLNINTTANGMPGNLLPRLPVYIVGYLGNDGLFYLEDTWWTQYEPTTEDGKIYIKVGESVYADYENARCYRADLVSNGYAYWYKDGAFRRFYGKESINSEYASYNNEFVYRQTSNDINLSNGSQGSISRVQGKTVSWNQMIDPLGVYSGGDPHTLNGNTFTITHNTAYNSMLIRFDKPTIANHYYYFSAKYKIIRDTALSYSYYLGYFGGTTTQWLSTMISGETLRSGYDYKVVKKASYNNPYILIGPYGNSGNNLDASDSVTVGNIMCIDLTLIYGAGNEPSTPEQFEADYLRWFGKPLIYEPYDEGSLRNVQMEGIKSVGFNQWDEEWELGGINVNTGENTSSTSLLRSKNTIPVLPQMSYCIHVDNIQGRNIKIFYYDSDNNFIGAPSGWVANNEIFSTPDNCHYIKFHIAVKHYGTTYNNDICINISDTNKNGTYEPYEEHNVSIPVTTLTGKVNGQGESVVIFPDGMKGVNDIKDEIKVENGVTKAIKRIGRVDLGSLSWGADSNRAGVFFSGVANKKSNTYVVCGRYYTYMEALSTSIDKYVSGKNSYNNGIFIRDTGYASNTAAQFKAAMSGVYLDYELEEPVEYVVDDFDLPVSYTVSKEGTEEIIPVTNEITVAPTLDITYGVNISDIKGLPKVSSNDNGKTLQVVNGLWALVSVPTIYTGTGVPSDLDGNDGDIYIQTF